MALEGGRTSGALGLGLVLPQSTGSSWCPPGVLPEGPCRASLLHAQSPRPIEEVEVKELGVQDQQERGADRPQKGQRQREGHPVSKERDNCYQNTYCVQAKRHTLSHHL